MSFRKRTLVFALVSAAAIGAYGTARHFAPMLVSHVVEQTLIQKAPEEMPVEEIRTRFHEMLLGLPDDGRRLERLLEISQYLEKTQRLKAQEVEWILGKELR